MMRDQRARMERDLAMTPVPVRAMQWPEAYPSLKPAPRPAPQPEQYGVWPGTWGDRIEMRLLGGVREDGDDFLKRVVSAPPPGNPEDGRTAGSEGVGPLQGRLKEHGRVVEGRLL